jgi:hypothetical protein
MRLDFANVKVHTTHKERDYNWLYWNTEENTYTLYLKQYKTAGKYGDFVIEFTDEDLVELLDLWFEKFNKSHKYLLTNYKDESKPLSETSLSHRIPKIFDKCLGKKINNGLLRQIKESNTIFDNAEDYNNLTLNQKIELHKRLGHSLETAHEYSKRD